VSRGRFRIKGDVLETAPPMKRLVRIERSVIEVEAIRYVDPTTGRFSGSLETG